MHRKLFIPRAVGSHRGKPAGILATPQVGHRLQEYKDLHGALIPKLKKCFYILAGTCFCSTVLRRKSLLRGTTKSDCPRKH